MAIHVNTLTEPTENTELTAIHLNDITQLTAFFSYVLGVVRKHLKQRSYLRKIFRNLFQASTFLDNQN